MNIFSQENIDHVQEIINKPNGNGYVNSKPVINGPQEADEQSGHMQQLMERIDSLPDSETKDILQDCLQEILSFYGNGLKKILDIISKGNNSTGILNNLIKDNFISSLLLIHDLHPLDVKTRLYDALEKVKPYIDGHGGNIEVVSIEKGIARIRLSGTCKGCPSSANTLELGIKKVVEENCPDIFGLEIEGIENGIIEMQVG